MAQPSPIAENVLRFRVSAGISQAELARLAELSRRAVARIEAGEVEPRATSLERVAKALGVPLSELVRPCRELQQVRFREGVGFRGREALLAEVGRWLEGYTWLEEQLAGSESEAVAGAGRAAPATLQRFLGRRRGAPTDLATELRAALDLDDEPIRDICGLLEAMGIKVLQLRRASNDFFGLSVGPADGGPVIVVNVWERISVERWIFSAAHELGHLLMHLAAGSYDRSGQEVREDEEREADMFASHFLMPEGVFQKEWDEAAGHSLLDRVLKVKRIFRVSYKTVLVRLTQAGTADGGVWKAFHEQHKRRFRKSLSRVEEPEALTEAEFSWSSAEEPERLARSDFIEDRLHKLVREALERELVSIGRAAELLRVPLEDMRRLARDWTA